MDPDDQAPNVASQQSSSMSSEATVLLPSQISNRNIQKASYTDVQR